MSENVIDNETQAQLDAFIKQEEGDSNDYKGMLAKFITLVACLLYTSDAADE